VPAVVLASARRRSPNPSGTVRGVEQNGDVSTSVELSSDLARHKVLFVFEQYQSEDGGHWSASCQHPDCLWTGDCAWNPYSDGTELASLLLDAADTNARTTSSAMRPSANSGAVSEYHCTGRCTEVARSL
jgi:hypothetical protein